MTAYIAPQTTLTASGTHLMGRIADGQGRGAATMEQGGEPGSHVARLQQAKAGTQQAEPPAFRPIIEERERQKGNWISRPPFLKFDLGSTFNYYLNFRSLGYGFQYKFPELRDKINHALSDAGKSSAPPESGWKKKDDVGTQWVSAIEGVAFTTIALRYTLAEANSLLRNFKPALAAELGKDIEDVNHFDLWQSSNPLLDTELNRLSVKAASRLASGGGFFVNFEVGLSTNITNIVLEKAYSMTDTAYDKLKNAVYKVQENHQQGEGTKEYLTNVMQSVVQQMQSDRYNHPVTEEEMLPLRPVFEDMAEDIINKTIGISEVVGIIGGGIIVMDDPAQSQANYQFIRDQGYEAVIEQAKERRLNNPDTQGTVWEQKKWAFEGNPSKSDMAHSARIDHIRKERSQNPDNGKDISIGML